MSAARIAASFRWIRSLRFVIFIVISTRFPKLRRAPSAMENVYAYRDCSLCKFKSPTLTTVPRCSLGRLDRFRNLERKNCYRGILAKRRSISPSSASCRTIVRPYPDRTISMLDPSSVTRHSAREPSFSNSIRIDPPPSANACLRELVMSSETVIPSFQHCIELNRTG